jgi:Tfp pilus assembly protein PilO
MKHLPKEKRDRLILVAVGTLAVIAGLYWGVVRVQRQTLVALAAKHGDEEIRVGNAQRLANSTAELQANLVVVNEKLKVVESTMPSRDLYSWIIQTINTFKENGGYKVEIPQFSREVAGEVGIMAKFPYRAAIFHVRGTAYYHDFGRFVADFENTFPYMRIQNIDLEPSGGTSASKEGGSGSSDDAEKLAFKFEIVTLINPNAP